MLNIQRINYTTELHSLEPLTLYQQCNMYLIESTQIWSCFMEPRDFYNWVATNSPYGLMNPSLDTFSCVLKPYLSVVNRPR